MIDIHTHLLPCVDDGSQSVENSVEMAKELYEQGVKQIIITPHYRLHYRKTPQVLQAEFEQFKAKVQAQIPIDLYLGQEIYVEDNIKELCRLNKVLTMNGSKFLLCEFNYTHPCDISETVYELCSEGYVPIIAHVERYVYLTIDDIYEIKNEGGLIQINAESLFSKNKRERKLVKKLFVENLVDFVSSDIHEDRQVYMAQAYTLVKKKFGEDVAKRVFIDNAEEIIKG